MPIAKYAAALMALIYCTVIQSSMASDGLRVVYAYGHENVFHDILQGFSVSTNIPLESQFIDQRQLKVRSMEMAELNTGVVPADAVILPTDQVGLYKFIKYSEVDPQLFPTKMPKRIWSASMIDGKFYGVPLIQGNHLILYYNKSLIKTPAHDWQTMFEQKAELTRKGVATIAWSYDDAYWFLPFLGAFGGWPMNDGKVELNTPAMISALDFFKDIVTIKKLSYPNCDKQCIRDLFLSGKVAYNISGEWDGEEFYKALGDNLGVTALPMAHNKKMVPSFSTYVIAFPNNSLTGPKRKSLMRLVHYLQSSAVQQQIWDQLGAIPVESSAFAYAQATGREHSKQIIKLMDDAKSLPVDSSMSFIWDAIAKGNERHLQGVLNSKQAALYIQQFAERHIDSAEQKFAK